MARNRPMLQRDAILKDLREHVIEVSFTKVNGENRVMLCTLKPELLPIEYSNEGGDHMELEFHQKNPDVISAWDVQKKDWRSFRMDSVLWTQMKDGYE